MEIGPDKTKVMTNNPNGFQREIKIEGQRPEKVEIKYLGAIISVKRRIKSRDSFTVEKFSISITQQLITAQTMLTGTQKSKAVMSMPVENKSKPLITATRQFIRNHGFFNYAFNFMRHYWSFCNF